MNISHRFRMFFLQRHADNLLRHAKQHRAYLNRPHVQSEHMIGPSAPKEPYLWLARVYVSIIVAGVCLAVYVNWFHEQPAIAVCTQLASR